MFFAAKYTFKHAPTASRVSPPPVPPCFASVGAAHEDEAREGASRRGCARHGEARACERGGDASGRALIFMSHRHSDKNTGVLVQTVTLRVSFRATLYLGQVHTALDQPGGFT